MSERPTFTEIAEDLRKLMELRGWTTARPFTLHTIVISPGPFESSAGIVWPDDDVKPDAIVGE
jgi:hypothetical protein